MENLQHTMLDKLWWVTPSIRQTKKLDFHTCQVVQFGPEDAKLTLVRRRKKNGCKYALWAGDICLKREYVPFAK